MFFKPLIAQPIIEKITCDDKEIEVFRVILSEEEKEACTKFSRNMWANRKTGQWGSGLINNSSDPTKAERTGCLGELAFGKLFGVEVNFSYKEFGVEKDFVIHKAYVDLKTSLKRPIYDAGLIRATNPSKKENQLSCDIYVFAYLDGEDVVLVGYELKKNIINLKKCPAKKGTHLNYEIPFSQLKPIRKLLETHKKIST